MTTEATRRNHATSKATRLLSAGTYLDPVYRKSVIKELLADRFRVVAPSYGYDAVTVLAHALAAHRIRRNQLWLLGTGAAGIVVLMAAGAFGPYSALLLFGWLGWATSYLRRIATIHTLMTRLKGSGPDGGFDGAYPMTDELTEELVQKIDHEQTSGDGVVYYGGYKPFVGAGKLTHQWASAELLIGAPLGLVERVGAVPAARAANGTPMGPATEPGPALAAALSAAYQAPETVARREVVSFSVADITAYVAARMSAQLRDEARDGERIDGLTVERRRFATAIATNDPAAVLTLTRLPGADDAPGVHWREDYASAREYLCIRIGSWDQELVTSMFVGFDIKGNTLHTEFYTYVLAPLIKDFHLVDRLPDAIDGRLLGRVAWDVAKSLPGDLLRLFLNPLGERLPRASRGRIRAKAEPVADNSEFRLGRYVTTAMNCGARASVREMATHRAFHHFFQESDAVKYTQVVERLLLQVISQFLADHHVDLADHAAQQTNILQQHFGDNSNFGAGNLSVGNSGMQTLGKNSSIGARAGIG